MKKMNRIVPWTCAALLAVTSGCADTSSARPTESTRISAVHDEVAPIDGSTVTQSGDPDGAPTRSVVVLWDQTESFRPPREALEQVFAGILGALGPGDDLLVADIGAPSFSPGQDVRVQCRMPTVPASILAKSSATRDWRRKSAHLAAIWAQVDARAGTLARLFSQPVERVASDGTDVHGAIRYAAHRLSAGPGAEGYLILLTDLLHEEGGRKTDLPFAEALGLERVRVTAAGVPWDDNRWAEKKTAWQRFVERSGGVSFSMLDSSEMLKGPLVPPTRVPRELKPPVPLDAEN